MILSTAKTQIHIFLDEVKGAGKHPCVNYIRGCRSQLDETYTKKRCEECRAKCREIDKKRRGKAIDNHYGK